MTATQVPSDGLRLIFVPGMKPKPPPKVHRRALWDALLFGLQQVDPPLAESLAQRFDRFWLVSWTYLFYGEHRDFELDRPGIQAFKDQPVPGPVDIKEIESLARRIDRWVRIVGDALPFLSRQLADPDTRLTMSEARRYLSDRHGIGREVRLMLKNELEDAWAKGDRVLLLGHSLGSVIAYDTLWEMSHEEPVAGPIDLFMTLGSPLATRFIRHRLRGRDRSGKLRYPTIVKRWVNFSARGELTALHPALAPYFNEMVTLGLIESIKDQVEFFNHFRGGRGLNVHKSYGYLMHPEVAGCIARWLREAGSANPAAV
jgi:hypothetical protein